MEQALRSHRLDAVKQGLRSHCLVAVEQAWRSCPLVAVEQVWRDPPAQAMFCPPADPGAERRTMAEAKVCQISWSEDKTELSGFGAEAVVVAVALGAREGSAADSCQSLGKLRSQSSGNLCGPTGPPAFTGPLVGGRLYCQASSPACWL